jgi:hypothetical protein
MNFVETNRRSTLTEQPAAQYPVNIRVTIPFLPRSFFLTLVAGREKRGPARRREERARHPLNTWGNLFVFIGSTAVFTIAALFAASVMATY